MIITKTPLRISFLGGGTDFREYFRQEGGCVVSSAINKYIRVIITKRFNDQIRIGYTRTELVDHIDEIEHELVRECLRKTGIHRGVEIFTIGDIPSDGSGLSSSSTATVGLLLAMYTHLNIRKTHEELAQEACEIEIDMIGKPIGVQDQYIVSYGGQRFLKFRKDGQIEVESLALSDRQRYELDRRLMLFFTNIPRQSDDVLAEQRANINHRLQILQGLKELAVEARASLEAGALDEFGLQLDKGWQLKKQMASRISNPLIDEMYSAALRAGALGGKISGAGGGGFMLLYCPPKKQDDVRLALSHLSELHFNLEQDGSKVIFNDRN
jgi:D-glycero-alpha-D-manno-heptose-7-phosphate kinase